jgi:ABC-type nitrate/sulfonate/bicarbonate transport system ATPase subunit
MGKVTVSDVSLQFETPNAEPIVALENLSMEVQDSTFAVIVGPSGCGKSSLLYLIAGLLETTGGVCSVDDRNIEGPGRDRGMVFQNYSLFPWLTVQKNVEFGLSLGGASRKERVERARHYIDAVGLSGFEQAYSSQLSGGMKQRVAIARALANDPEVLLMDEPFGALDSQTRSIMQELLLSVWEKEKKTVLFVTHDIDESLFLGDIVYVMSSRPGRITDEISVTLERPRAYDIVTTEPFLISKRRIMSNLHEEVRKTISTSQTHS